MSSQSSRLSESPWGDYRSGPPDGWRDNRRSEGVSLLTLVGLAAAAAVVVVGIMAIPDIKRYLRIRNM